MESRYEDINATLERQRRTMDDLTKRVVRVRWLVPQATKEPQSDGYNVMLWTHGRN
jgi:hypothetical protein